MLLQDFCTIKGGNNMTYFEESLKRLISKKGVKYAIETLSSPNLPEEIKVSLSKKYYFVDGYPNVSLIYGLIHP